MLQTLYTTRPSSSICNLIGTYDTWLNAILTLGNRHMPRPKKNALSFYFLLPPDSGHICGTIGPTRTVHLSICAEFSKENTLSTTEMI